jgi:hopanoid biosynthesis associated RND transporter like protein HpnN
MHERIRDILLASWGRVVAARPRLTLLVCLLVAAASIVLTATGLEFHADRSSLVDPDEPWNRRFLEYKLNFPHYLDVIVVLDGSPDDTRVDALARTIADRLHTDQRVTSADAGFDTALAGPTFFRLAGADEFGPALDRIAMARRLVGAENANAALGVLLAQLGQAEGDPSALADLERFLGPYLDAPHGLPADFSFLLPSQSRWQPLTSRDGRGRLRFVSVHLDESGTGINRIADTVAWIRDEIGRLVAESDIPDVEWGVTGLPVIEADETSEAIHDSTIASVLAIGLITLLMVLAFRGLMVPLLAATALLVGMAWSFGWLMLSVGHLQLLSVVFTVILLGLGIDFALIVVSRLELIRDEYDDLASATSRVFRRMGPGMVTGAVTTAAAFAATAFTDFLGMAEMGTIAAGGIILCLVAVLSTFVALLALTGRWKRIIRLRPGGEHAHFAGGRLDFVDNHPVRTLITAGVVVAALALLTIRVEYDPNVLNLQSEGVESVEWESRIVDEDAQGVWNAVVLCAPDQTPDLVERLGHASGVAGVGGMGKLFPPDGLQRQQMIATVREREVPVLRANPDMTTALTQLAAVRAGLMMRGRSAPPELKQRIDKLADRIVAAGRTAELLTRDQRRRSWTDLNTAFVTARDQLSIWVDAALAPGPPNWADLPRFLRDSWIGADGSWLLLVYPEADPQHRSVLDPDRLEHFVVSVRTAVAGTDVAVIGPTIQIYESSRIIKSEYIKAAIYAIAAILIVLCLDFRRLSDALCAMAPVTIGFVGAFGVMGLLGVPLNFANIIVLPIIFGIGVSAGVHVVHRWRLEPDGRPRGLSGGTGRGITLTMLTSMIGFGCLLIAQHRGIRSLGLVMVIGLGVTLLACYFILPAILKLRDEGTDQKGTDPFTGSR